MSKWKSNFLFFLLAAVSFVAGIKLLREPDMWWYLLTGEWIIQNGQVPTMDPFSFTFAQTEWINVKWMYEIIVYFFSELGGPEFTTVFQGIVNVLIVWILFLVGKTIYKGQLKLEYFTWIFIPCIFLIEYRLTGRPESTSLFFSILSLLLFFKFKKEDKKWIYGLIPLQILWTNTHEAYGIGMVLSLVYLGSGIFEQTVLKQGKTSKELIIGTIGSLLAVSCNPRGIQMISHPFEIFSQLGENKFTTELYSASHPIYWEQWQSYGFIFVLILVLGQVSFDAFNSYKKEGNPFLSLPIAYIIILVLFAYLGFSAHRNIPFFILAAIPLLSANIHKLIPADKPFKLAFPSAILLSILAYVFFVSNHYYRLSNSTNRFGIGIYAEYNPLGLGNHLLKTDYSKNHFSDFNTSAYMMWNLRPDYKSFIDLRDLDIYPSEFFRDVMLCNENPAYFDFFADQYTLEYAYMNRASFSGLISALHKNENWKMTFADPVSVMFEKAFDTTSTKDIFTSYRTNAPSQLAQTIQSILNPLYNTPKSIENEDLLAASFYLSIGEYDLGISRSSASISRNQDMVESYGIQSELLNLKALAASTVAEREKLNQEAYGNIRKGLEIDKASITLQNSLGLIYFRNGMYAEAMSAFKIVVKSNPSNANVWSLMANCQNSLSVNDPQNSARYTNNWFKYMEKASKHDPKNAIYNYQLGVSYCQRNDCEKAKKYLENLEPIASLSDEDNQQIIRCKRLCKVD